MTTPVVDSYLDAIRAHDWALLADSVTDNVVRVGPFGDTYKGRDEYVGFIASLMPTLPGYAMDVHAVTQIGQRAFVELAETVTVEGSPTVTNEVLVFELDGDRIARIDIFIQRSPL
jgi:limonene-1,2-epoxide hydrolase